MPLLLTTREKVNSIYTELSAVKAELIRVTFDNHRLADQNGRLVQALIDLTYRNAITQAVGAESNVSQWEPRYSAATTIDERAADDLNRVSRAYNLELPSANSRSADRTHGTTIPVHGQESYGDRPIDQSTHLRG